MVLDVRDLLDANRLYWEQMLDSIHGVTYEEERRSGARRAAALWSRRIRHLAYKQSQRKDYTEDWAWTN